MTSKELRILLQKCRKKNRLSQKELYRHFYNYAMTVCSRYARNDEEAREILNDGFFKVFTRLDQYSFDRSFKAWLNKILVHTAIDHFRKRQGELPVVDLVHAQHIGTDSSVLSKLSAQDLMKLVQQLSPVYRLVFNLHVIEGFSHPEIAKQLDISVGTSKSNLAKARMKLRAMIQSLEEKKSKYG